MASPSAVPDAGSGHVRAWQPILLGALAGGMAWGIRGQYGHETGAMIAGLLVSLALILSLAPAIPIGTAARAVAMATIAIGFGGSMTYGQTVGLTHDAPLVGNGAALRWGLIGLGIKGGIWIGFGGLFLGMGLGGIRYRPREILALMLGLLALHALGVQLLNRPFDPAQRILPAIYFSDDWHWEPDATLKPRAECWGGLLFALIGAWIWSGWIRGDRLARHLAAWAFLGGAIGFPLGQSLQAFHAWNPELFRSGIGASLDPVMNWWNWMETTFGAVMGAAIGFGLWHQRNRIAPEPRPPASMLTPGLEWVLILLHVTLLVTAEFGSVPFIDALYDPGLILGLIPMVGVVGGRWWPFLLAFPVTLIPIAGKTFRQIVLRDQHLGLVPGAVVYLVLPLAAMTALALWAGRRADRTPARRFAAPALILCTWIYFSLNFAFFHFPWPWSPWTARTPNALAYTICALGLTVAALRGLGRDPEQRHVASPDGCNPPDHNPGSGGLRSRG